MKAFLYKALWKYIIIVLCHDLHFYPVRVAKLCSYEPTMLKRYFPAL